ncbi:MAG: Fur family transcriptional regulator [Acidimicrobiales bacterium]
MDVHDQTALRLAALDQRYTRGRRAIVTVLASAGRPLTVPEILDGTDRGALPQSSAYRNLTVLNDAAVVRRLPGTDEFARYELAEELAGHHHHFLCDSCGTVADVSASPRLERALAEAARVAADESGFKVTGHRMDLLGRCRDCR